MPIGIGSGGKRRSVDVIANAVHVACIATKETGEEYLNAGRSAGGCKGGMARAGVMSVGRRLANISVAVLLAVGALSSANACNTRVDLGQHTFPSVGSGTNSCLGQQAKTHLWLSNTESGLYEQYLNGRNGCVSAGNRHIQCIYGLSQYYNQSSIDSAVREMEQNIAECQRFFDESYEKYAGTMCN